MAAARPTTARALRQQLIGEKIAVLRHEGKSEAQAAAIAMHMARAKRLLPGGIYRPKG